MAGDTTIQALERLTRMPDSSNPAMLIAAQRYYDVYFTGGLIENVTLSDVGFADSVQAYSGAHTLTDTDKLKYLRYTGAGNIWTIPANATEEIDINAEYAIFNAGTGDITLTADTGVTVNGVTAGSTTIPPYFGAFLKKITTNGWDHAGVGAANWSV